MNKTMAFNGGLGLHSMWGFSPSMNLLKLCFHEEEIDLNEEEDVESRIEGEGNREEEERELEPINILLVQPSDPRHVIHTLSQRLRSGLKEQKSIRPINFYILESETEVLARHILLLHIFFDSDIPIRQRAALYLEIFGNALVQKRTERYIADAGSLLRGLIYDDKMYSSDRSLKRITNFDHLKQKEKDEISDVFKSWKMENQYDVQSYRDYRLRGYYGDRYDCRQNLIDWDYYSRVKEVASIIHTKQFLKWRMDGIAFEFGDADYSCPNRSMSSYTKAQAKNGRDRGMMKEFQGFWLDILVGPFISHGVHIDSNSKQVKQLFDIVNKGSGAEQHRHHTVDVSMYNLLGFMWETETNQIYEMKKEREIFSGLGQTSITIGNNKDRKGLESNIPDDKRCSVEDGDSLSNHMSSHENGAKAISSGKRNPYIEQSIQGITINLVKGDFKTITSRKKYRGMFHQIHLSQKSAHWLGDVDLKEILNRDNEHESKRRIQSIISVETTKFMFPLKEKQQAAMKTKIIEIGRKNGLNPLGHVEESLDSHVSRLRDLSIVCFY